MRKLTIELPDDTLEAIGEEAEREFRLPPAQAAFLLVCWARERHAKRGPVAPIPKRSPEPAAPSSRPIIAQAEPA
jgi:hypothetical protein